MTGLANLEKRVNDQALYDLDCSLVLAVGETIASVTSITVEPTTTPPITLGVPTVNANPITYKDRFGSSTTAPAGTVIQVLVGGGRIASGRQVQDYTVRARFATALNPAIEVMTRLRVHDRPNT